MNQLMRIRYFVVSSVLAICLTSSDGSEPKGRIAISDKLRQAISRVHAKAEVIERKDVSVRNCDPVPESPGLIRADFNGDGLTDYAALLRIRGTEKQVLEENKTWTLVEVRLVVFLGQRGGEFTNVELERLSEVIPILTVIEIQRPGPIREYAEIEHEKRKVIQIEKMSIMRIGCGRSAVVFTWDDSWKRFRMITVSD